MTTDQLDIDPTENTTWESVSEDLKQRINDLLWQALPGDTSLSDAEALACAFFEKIRGTWEIARVEKDKKQMLLEIKNS